MLFRVIRRPATVSSSCSHKATGGDGEGPGFQHFRLWGDQWPRSMVESTWKGFVMMLRVTRRPLTMSSSISHNEGGTGGFAEGTGFRQKRFDHRESPKAPLPLIRLLHSSWNVPSCRFLWNKFCLTTSSFCSKALRSVRAYTTVEAARRAFVSNKKESQSRIFQLVQGSFSSPREQSYWKSSSGKRTKKQSLESFWIN